MQEGPARETVKERLRKSNAGRVTNRREEGVGPAAVFPRDIARGREIAARRLEAGACFVDAFVTSDPRLPFGGIKESGHGHELVRESIREFVNR